MSARQALSRLRVAHTVAHVAISDICSSCGSESASYQQQNHRSRLSLTNKFHQMLIFQFQKGGVFDIRDASMAGCCTFEEGIYFPPLWEQPVLQNRGKLFSCFGPLDAQSSWMYDVAAKKTQDSQLIDSSVNAEFFCQFRSPSLVGLDRAYCV